MSVDQFSIHLEQAHGIVSAQDKHQAYLDSLQIASSGLQDSTTNLDSWRALVKFATALEGDRAFATLATAVTQSLRRVPYKKRAKAISNAGSA
ncbi:MAG TPA: hypothetical protein VGZ25_15430, partial [Gemmataceae bacterium]|nr:hypothetical protein [Gemmataceae bacterium]